ncbi:hypothetical protein F4806DRAFT_200546 [Annulohypoxylon nitens]|nr:hypothetical protein F4806DRAFT_200546 [Annulohypoxylon nitens]
MPSWCQSWTWVTAPAGLISGTRADSRGRFPFPASFPLGVASSPLDPSSSDSTEIHGRRWRRCTPLLHHSPSQLLGRRKTQPLLPLSISRSYLVSSVSLVISSSFAMSYCHTAKVRSLFVSDLTTHRNVGRTVRFKPLDKFGLESNHNGRNRPGTSLVLSG